MFRYKILGIHAIPSSTVQKRSPRSFTSHGEERRLDSKERHFLLIWWSGNVSRFRTLVWPTHHLLCTQSYWAWRFLNSNIYHHYSDTFNSTTRKNRFFHIFRCCYIVILVDIPSDVVLTGCWYAVGWTLASLGVWKIYCESSIGRRKDNRLLFAE